MKQLHCKINTNGSKFWYLNDKLHREDGLAVIYANGAKEWHINGNIHREDGPAIEWADGTKSWWINDKIYTFNEYVKELNWPAEQIVMYKLRYG